MKIGISLYSFHKYAEDKISGVRECIKKSAEMGFDGLDFVEVGLEYEEYLAYARDIKEYCRSLEIEPRCFCTGADFLRCDDINAEVERVKRNIDIAKAYGCSVFRHDISSGFQNSENNDKDYDRAIEIVAPAIRQITKYAEDKGIVTTTENHGFFSQDSGRVKKLIEAVNEKNFGALVDIGNFSCADEENVSATGNLAPMAYHAHVKDFHVKDRLLDDPGSGWFKSRGGNYLRGSIIGHGNLPVKSCITALKNGGYDGYLTIEFEGLEDPLKAISIGYENLKKYINYND